MTLRCEGSDMKSKHEVQQIIDEITSAESPVGIDAVYVHAVILDYLARITERLERLEEAVQTGETSSQ